MTHNTRERIEEWEKKFDEMWTILDFEVCTRDKSMNTQTLDDYESAQSDDIKDFIHQELQKAREELVYEIRADLLNYRDERLDDNASITNIAIRIGLNYTRKDQSDLDQPLPDNPNPHESK